MIIANEDQSYVVSEAKKWYSSLNDQVFQFTGGPGTGKSVVLNMIADELGIDRRRIAPMSFIGAAAIVMRMKGFVNARTAHSWLYNPVDTVKLDTNGMPIYNTYFNTTQTTLGFEPKRMDDIDIAFVDEGYAMPMYLAEELKKRGIPIVVTGDKNQLPPVGDLPGFLANGKIYELHQIMRQAEGSGIIYLADRMLKELPIHKGVYGNVLVVEEDELTDQMIAASNIVIACKNDTREAMTKHIREEMLGITTDFPLYGEKVVCRKNNAHIEIDGINLANGLLGTVASAPDISGFDGKIFKMDFRPNLLNESFKELNCDYKYFIADHKQRQILKNDRFSIGEKFEFGYCITDHMAQGSQFPGGIYIQEYINKDINKNLDYTGITRFSNWAIVVIRKKKYY